MQFHTECCIRLTRESVLDDQTWKTGYNALSLAAYRRRWDLFPCLVSNTKDISACDKQGRSSLFHAVQFNDGCSMAMAAIKLVIRKGAAPNDGSLHSACRSLDLPLVKVLLEAKHIPNYESPRLDGRTALAVLCTSADLMGQKNTFRAILKLLQRAGAELNTKVDGKPLLFACLDDETDAKYLAVCLAKTFPEVAFEDNFNELAVDGYIYSAPMYVEKGLAEVKPRFRAEVVEVLRSAACRDTYYRLEGPQPADAVGVPSEPGLPAGAVAETDTSIRSEPDDLDVQILTESGGTTIKREAAENHTRTAPAIPVVDLTHEHNNRLEEQEQEHTMRLRHLREEAAERRRQKREDHELEMQLEREREEARERRQRARKGETQFEFNGERIAAPVQES